VQTVEVHLWDDVDHKRDGSKVPAEVQVELTYKTRRGTRHVRLDLSAAHGAELDQALAPFLAAGTALAAPDGQDQVQVRSGGKIRRGPPGGPGGREARAWRAELRAWSDSLGLVNREDPAFPAWKTVTDKHYYPSDLEDAFIAYKDGREAEALRLVAKFKPQAAA
jgi:hypothetical protein